MERIAVFPGSFDPVTRGHEDIILRALPLFDKVYIAIGSNTEKKSCFSLEQRADWVRVVFKDMPSIHVITYSGLTVDLCAKLGAQFIIRGLRTSADFEFERSIGQINRKLDPGIETVFLLTSPEFTSLNSSIVRDILRHGGDASQFVPREVNLGGLPEAKE
ncbi:MAG: pantetheine-phosphate adenylyltransferase [Bacteroidales bacterium]|nr:pantetheine-phosphate adenylyltransferase [Bacteroidales bacterium]